MASISPNLEIEPPEIQPADIYGSEGPVRLRIATGGAGKTGLLKTLAEAFLAHRREVSHTFRMSPWTISWLLTDTSLSYNALASRSADIAITYHPYADLITVAQGVSERREYIFRDAFCLVGPRSNPAKLPLGSDLSVYELFTLIFCAAVHSDIGSPEPVRFLSRYDKSANNILESRIWTTIGQTPWADPSSTFYHRFVGFPVAALKAANSLGEYCLVDRGTWYTCDSAAKESLVCFKEGTIHGHDTATDSYDGGQPYALNNDALSNPAHALLGRHAKFKEEGMVFIDWLVSEEGGRRIVRELNWDGVQSYGVPPVVSRDAL